MKFGVDGPAIRNSVVLCNLLPLVLRKCGTHYKSIKVSVAVKEVEQCQEGLS